MQLKKVKIMKSIKEIAVNEFYRHGYKDTNMRDIAAHVGVTVGNIYRYYPSKAVLFESILDPVLEKIEQLITAEHFLLKPQLTEPILFENVIRPMLSICGTHPKEIIIVLTKSQNSKYENAHKTVVQSVMRAIGTAYPQMDLLFTKVIATALISGLLVILEECPDDSDKIHELFLALLYFLFQNFNEKSMVYQSIKEKQ